jgi:hypothetical protein
MKSSLPAQHRTRSRGTYSVQLYYVLRRTQYYVLVPLVLVQLASQGMKSTRRACMRCCDAQVSAE